MHGVQNGTIKPTEFKNFYGALKKVAGGGERVGGVGWCHAKRALAAAVPIKIWISKNWESVKKQKKKVLLSLPPYSDHNNGAPFSDFALPPPFPNGKEGREDWKLRKGRKRWRGGIVIFTRAKKGGWALFFALMCGGGGPQRGLFKPPLLVQKQGGGGEGRSREGKGLKIGRNISSLNSLDEPDPPLAISRNCFSGLFVVQKVISNADKFFLNIF